MWDKVKKFLGYVWASPVTVVGLAYVGIFNALGWYNYYDKTEDALIWKTNSSKMPQWLGKLWKPWAGHTVGNVVVMNENFILKTLYVKHELVHARQCMRLGVFQPIVYGINLLAIKIGCEASSPYWSNPFEIDARRVVGQLIDVEGALKNAKSKKDSN